MTVELDTVTLLHFAKSDVFPSSLYQLERAALEAMRDDLQKRSRTGRPGSVEFAGAQKALGWLEEVLKHPGNHNQAVHGKGGKTNPMKGVKGADYWQRLAQNKLRTIPASRGGWKGKTVDEDGFPIGKKVPISVRQRTRATSNRIFENTRTQKARELLEKGSLANFGGKKAKPFKRGGGRVADDEERAEKARELLKAGLANFGNKRAKPFKKEAETDKVTEEGRPDRRFKENRGAGAGPAKMPNPKRRQLLMQLLDRIRQRMGGPGGVPGGPMKRPMPGGPPKAGRDPETGGRPPIPQSAFPGAEKQPEKAPQKEPGKASVYSRVSEPKPEAKPGAKPSAKNPTHELWAEAFGEEDPAEFSEWMDNVMKGGWEAGNDGKLKTMRNSKFASFLTGAMDDGDPLAALDHIPPARRELALKILAQVHAANTKAGIKTGSLTAAEIAKAQKILKDTRQGKDKRKDMGAGG